MVWFFDCRCSTVFPHRENAILVRFSVLVRAVFPYRQMKYKYAGKTKDLKLSNPA